MIFTSVPGSLLVVLVVSSFFGFIIASPIRPYSSDKQCVFNGESCEDIADRLIANMSINCGLYLEPELPSSVPSNVKDMCEEGKVIISAIIATITELREQREINTINSCSYENSSNESENGSEECWSVDDAYLSIVNYYVALEHIVNTLGTSYHQRDQTYFKLYRKLISYVQRMRCSYGILTKEQKLGCSFGGFFFESNETAKAYILSALKNQPELPNPSENETYVMGHECKVLKNFKSTAENIYKHLENQDQPCPLN